DASRDRGVLRRWRGLGARQSRLASLLQRTATLRDARVGATRVAIGRVYGAGAGCMRNHRDWRRSHGKSPRVHPGRIRNSRASGPVLSSLCRPESPMLQQVLMFVLGLVVLVI